MRKRIFFMGVCLVISLFWTSTTTIFAQDFCEGNFNYDQDVDGSDAALFMTDFGRSPFSDPCPPDGPAPVPQTGKTTSWAAGDDGDLERGVALPTPRFTVNGNGTVTDNLTGLIWLEDANCFGLRTWNNAINDSNGLANGACGLTDGSIAGDWRLPNRNELNSLINIRYVTPALSNIAGDGPGGAGDPFLNVQDDYYWSSSLIVSNNWAYCVDLTNGIIDIFTILPATSNYVWPVRGGR